MHEHIVDKAERAKRSKMLHILSEKKKRAFYKSQVGKSGLVLWEEQEDEGKMYGFTENYIKVKSDYQAEKVNTFEWIKYDVIDRDGLMKISTFNPEKILA